MGNERAEPVTLRARVRASGVRVRDVLWAVVVFACGALQFDDLGASGWESPAFWIAVAALAAAVLLRNASIATATVLAIAAGGLFVAARPAGPIAVVIGYTVVFATLGASRERLWRTVGAIGIAAGGLTGALWVVRMAWPEFVRAPGELWSVIGFVAVAAAMVCLIGYVIGLVQRQRTAAAEVRAARAEQVWADRLLEQERERNRLAREMHDVVAHSLAVIVMQSQGARYIQHTDPARAGAALETIGDIARDALADVRILLGRLRTGDGAPSTRDAAAQDLEDLVGRLTESGCVIRFDGAGAPPLPDWVHRTDATRALPELIINAAKHGDDAEPITLVHERSEGRTTVTVANTIAAAPSSFPRGGNGLVGLREALAEVGGSLEASADAGRWRAVVTVPDRPAEPPEHTEHTEQEETS
ncbi:sensor histidine kinase [Tsukamurella pulmonis]|uniref:sensor histidine kinase n=2 Tax=Tsukamurella pulmonis TaxID=47312 RepID=UPI0008392634|nr:histidine kinase [Tsukamurella pulmonis]